MDYSLKRALIVFGTIITLTIIGAVIYIKLANSNQDLTVNYKTTLKPTVSIYKGVDNGTPTPTEKAGERLANLEAGKKFTLPRGPYIVTVGGGGVEPSTQGIFLGDTPIKLELNIAYTSDTLETQRPEAYEAVKQVLLQKYPQVNDLYTINPGRLYGEGNWFGTTLTYKGKDPEVRDTLRFVARKEGSIWTLATKPSITLGQETNPSIPHYILKDVNKPVPLPAIGNTPGATPSLP